MAIELYDLSIPVFIRHLKGLEACLKKGQRKYAEQKCDERTLLCYRLYPDMFDFAKQVQLATDHPRIFAALLSGLPPKAEGDEKTLTELIARCERTRKWLESMRPEQINGTEEKSVTVRRPAGDLTMDGRELLLARTLPNFFFHYTTAYDILRHNGVELGKKDFMGA